MDLINQIKNLIEDIENSNDDIDIILKHFELAKLILLNNNSLNESIIRELEDSELFSEIFFEVGEINKILINFISNYIDFIEEDLRGSSFEENIISNSKKLKELLEEKEAKAKLYEELKAQQKEIDEREIVIDELNKKIVEYEEIDLDEVLRKESELKEKLELLESEKGELIKRYQKHFEANKKIDLYTEEITNLLDNIDVSLEKVDSIYKDILESKK